MTDEIEQLLKNLKFGRMRSVYDEQLRAAEKQQLIAQIDTKLADAVTSFLVETLGHNVDLGAQSDYLISVLDEHKAEFTKRVTDEV